MATADDAQPGVNAGWRRPWASLLVFALAWPVGFGFIFLAVLLSFGGSDGHTDQGSRSIAAEALALVVMALAGLLPLYGLRLARTSLQQQMSVVGRLGLGLNAAALVFLAIVVVINALELLHAFVAHTV